MGFESCHPDFLRKSSIDADFLIFIDFTRKTGILENTMFRGTKRYSGYKFNNSVTDSKIFQ